jgi:hypothetical protein
MVLGVVLLILAAPPLARSSAAAGSWPGILVAVLA